MVLTCVGCGVRDKEGKILFRFPKYEENRNQWLDALGLDKENLGTTSVVCEVRKTNPFVCKKKFAKI